MSETLTDLPRQRAIIDYIYTGKKAQPETIEGIKVKPINYSSEFQRNEVKDLPKHVKVTYQEEIIPRIVDSRVKERESILRTLDYGDGPINLSEEQIQMELKKYKQELTEQLNEMLNNRGYIEISPQVMKEYNYRHSGEPTRVAAFYDPSTKNIVASSYLDNNLYNLDDYYKFLGHEVRHWYDDLFPATADEEFYLKQAYNDVFDDLPNIYSHYSKGYVMNPERLTTNRDAREMIFQNYFRPKSIREQNKLIDELSDKEIVNAVENANGYGRDYIRTLRERNMLTKDVIQKLRNAMKYVGVSTGVATTVTKIPNDKKGGKLIPKHQSGGQPNTFVGAATKALGGNYKTADKISAAASIYPPAGIILGALDLGYDLNGVYHGDKTGKDVVLDIFSMIPGLKYAKSKINLMKKSKDPLMYYYKELNKYIKKYADRINEMIGLGKTSDVIDDATH